MLVSDGPSNFNFWGEAAAFLGGDQLDDSDDYSISVERFYDILNENQSQNSSKGNVDVSSMKSGFLIPEFPEIPSDSKHGESQHPWSLPFEASQPGFNPLSSANNLEFPILRGNNGVDNSLLSLENNDGASDAHIDPMNEGILNGTLDTDGKHVDSLVSLDSFGGFADAYTDQICDEDMLNKPQQVDLKPLVNHDAGNSYSDWLSLSPFEQGMFVKSTIETPVLPGPTQGVDNRWANELLGHVGSSNLDVEDIDLLSDSACVVDLTLSDSDDEVLLENMKNGLPFHMGAEQVAGGMTCNLISQDFQHNRCSPTEHQSISMKKESVFFNSENVSSMSRQKSSADVVPFVQESSEIFSAHAFQNLQLSSTNFPGSFSNDADVYIVEDISVRGHPPLMTMQNKVPTSSQPPIFGDSFHRVGPGEERGRTYDERLTYRLALQDLSQPRKEVSPPDGVLAVPLLRHQRIALSWMLQKETATLHCSGGILADDQGLGKTVSMIALILMEKSPSLKTSSEKTVDVKPEPLDLDEDDGTMGPGELKQTGNSECSIGTKSFGSESTTSTCKRRPAAGTLVVCPTSVLRQWAEELQNKVSAKAKLSVLVYHGSNRTRDPDELAKYDVVLTTYSIVSMEVPKQPLVDQDDEKRNDESEGLTSDSFSGKKRKHYQNDKKNSKKNKKVAENSEPFARPLARVGWFRVILDEAQSIKNHRTQVARACWGLRAKRRWCLSGTPIQNAIDDLYSYFRFLRYDPYAVYKSFCTTIKNPISRSPTTGYKKLQAVLQTIMLRRTKGTIIDGEPIIKLPPKSISLKKVDFSMDERDFYSRLEADSREQFKVYADAGTVKQNYVNILLMLLRLRQACDHPKLVKGFDSAAVQRFSLESAKKLPREKQEELLNNLEACLSLCGICNDPPEDAVVTICSHVFCNQCICERLSGDENICPAAHCKKQINISSVFSRNTLKISLDESTEHNISAISGCELVKAAEKSTDFPSIESSKIRAALDILQTLPEVPQADSRSISVGHTYDSVTEGCHSEQNSKPLRVTEKAIVFSQWTRMLDLLEVPLKNSSINYRRLDGTMSVLARDKAVKDFNSLPEVSVMIMSLKAASLGLNMVAACHVLLLDLWWNPTTEDQAIDRAHRIGQTRPVSVTRLTVKDTVEDRILALQEKKRVMVAAAFGEDERGGRQTRLTEDDLKYLFMI
ncbi:helicase-like transcription factor CHR28 isoform X2 [Nymphaea colorata]|uniref:helicase-like transcription factor CHR28 isoform X2 n=1 Tax=Nymphaea colorata TaxID=210225 RepID=UPI00129E07A0|nr:helicase-like transcription factor CHR28 isoform X2 [Nymphaea colorata]